MSVVKGGLNYFTCTLAQAAQWKLENQLVGGFDSVIDLVDKQARLIPQSPALGFAQLQPIVSATCLPPPAISFLELRDLSKVSACLLANDIGSAEDCQPPGAIGLLCTSSFNFVLTWLGLTRLGYSILLLAPQLESHAISHLCSSTGATAVFVDQEHWHKISSLRKDIRVFKTPPEVSRRGQQVIDKLNERHLLPDIAYFVHTSGTSSGLPKAIPQSHKGLIGALPPFPGVDKPATFTTTPLYHGGLVDCFRAWTSGAMIWFFPEGAGPITALNLERAVNFARHQTHAIVKYFTSVPYILQILAQEDSGIQLLQTMDLVAFGGAALPIEVGDKLVEAGVHLLSRLGSAECGFLMSSHRDYSKDKAWQYLRPTTDSKLILFELQESGLFELIVKSKWPYKVKFNRDDGAYATSDLFEMHKSIPNAWRYHSRADAQITLANGKKFDPAPIEASILATTIVLKDVLVFGNGREYPGLLLFPASNEFSQESVVDTVWSQVEKMNRLTQSHARIAKSMLVVIRTEEGEASLAKSSKGTVLRPQAEKRYAKVMESAYVGGNFTVVPFGDLCDEELLPTVMDCFCRVLGYGVDPDNDLYHQGVDSIASSQIRTLVESTCWPRRKLPMNIIYDQGTVSALVEFLRQLRRGAHIQDISDHSSQMELMRKLAAKYSHAWLPCVIRAETVKRSIVLTGSTGFLGAHILDLLCKDRYINKVYCLVRASSPSVARHRVSESLRRRGLSTLQGLQESHNQDSKVVCLPCNLASRSLGLSGSDRQRLVREATTYIHSAWAVNFALPLQSFEAQIAGTRHLVDTAIEGGAHFVFISSIAAVSQADSRPVVESVSSDPSDASPLGYAQSKWVAERVCVAASHSQHIHNVNSRPISIIRVGQLCGNDAGIWNASEAYPLMLSTANIIHCLPSLDELLNWLPVHTAARAVLEIALSEGIRAAAGDLWRADPLVVHHVLNSCRSPSWNQMLQWLLDEIKDGSLEIVSPSDWLARLEKKFETPNVSHPSQALLYFWKNMIGQKSRTINDSHSNTTYLEFETTSAMAFSGTMCAIRPLGRQEIVQMWKWITKTI